MTKVQQKENNVNTLEGEEIGDKLVRGENGQFVNGHPDLGAGRPQGVRNFSTDFEEAVGDLAKVQGITFSEARKELLKVAYVKAKEGNFPYHKDIMDRYYGDAEPEKPQEVTVIKEQKNIYILVDEFEKKVREELEK